MADVSAPDTTAIVEKTAPLRDQAEAMVVVDSDSAEAAAQMRKELAKLRKEIEGTFDAPIKAAHHAHKEMIAARDKHLGPVKAADAIVKQSLESWVEAERKREREIARREAERVRKEREEQALKEAQEREEKGEVDLDLDQASRDAEFEASLVQDQTEEELRQAKAPISGASVREVWSAHVEDKKALVEYVAANFDTVGHYLDPNMKLLNSMAKQLKDTMKIPGVRAASKASVATR